MAATAALYTRPEIVCGESSAPMARTVVQ